MGPDAQTDSRPALATYQFPDRPLFAVGLADTGVTVLSQQVRALNLAWALIEEMRLLTVLNPKCSGNQPQSVAIVGGGFAGLAVAAGLIKKGVHARLTLFEERDTLLPLQHGSDTRWLHPRIYDWPAEGSESNAAMLPVQNWTAARASDVVVQILAEWKQLIADVSPPPALYCNARHLQIYDLASTPDKLYIEWVGEQRNAGDATTVPETRDRAVGRTESFDSVIVAAGFGLEKDRAPSYWRNDTLGQPSLEEPRLAYLISGQGDGAMIDLLRLRISQYRQDRILGELFHKTRGLRNELKRLHGLWGKRPGAGLFRAFENLETHPKYATEFSNVRTALAGRLRRDTEVILHLKLSRISELFDREDIRISFQNKILTYLLYKCGGFIPSTESERALARRHSIPPSRIIRRHGTERINQLKRSLSEPLRDELDSCLREGLIDRFLQTDDPLWPGGYFGYPGTKEESRTLGDREREHWRKEYLPGPTELLATSFCASIAGALLEAHPEPGRLRVTLHRAVILAGEELLQQCCEYSGTHNARGAASSAARTFPAANATIGLAYKCRKAVRSREGVTERTLRKAMRRLNLNEASKKMSRGVRFVLAIPILEPEEPRSFTAPSPVAGVLYVDSMADGFFVSDDEIGKLAQMTGQFVSRLEEVGFGALNRISNVALSGIGMSIGPPGDIPSEVTAALELVPRINLPRTSRAFQLNFDYSDFIPVGT